MSARALDGLTLLAAAVLRRVGWSVAVAANAMSLVLVVGAL